MPPCLPLPESEKAVPVLWPQGPHPPQPQDTPSREGQGESPAWTFLGFKAHQGGTSQEDKAGRACWSPGELSCSFRTITTLRQVHGQSERCLLVSPPSFPSVSMSCSGTRESISVCSPGHTVSSEKTKGPLRSSLYPECSCTTVKR